MAWHIVDMCECVCVFKILYIIVYRVKFEIQKSRI